MSVNEPEPTPLDPEAALVVARVRRMMLIAGVTTLVAVAAVFGVIGYRIFKSGGSAASEAGPPVAAQTLMLPKGAKVLGTAISDGRIAVTLETADGIEIRTFSLHTLKPAGELRLRAAP
jgi:hypothetical protein